MLALASKCSIGCMRIATGTVIGGKVVVQGEALPEGTVVTIVARESAERFVIPRELEPELQASLAEAERGETISADRLLSRLRRRG